jgi:hypothetical protein
VDWTGDKTNSFDTVVKGFSDRAVKSIMPVCRYAICPVPDCMGLVIPAFEQESRKMFLELSRKWYLQCPVCQHHFLIADFKLKSDEISFVRIRQT